MTRLCSLPFPFRTGGSCPPRPFCDCRASRVGHLLRILSRRRLADLTVAKQPSGTLFFSAIHVCVLLHLHPTPPVSAWTGVALLSSTLLFAFSDMGLPGGGTCGSRPISGAASFCLSLACNASHSMRSCWLQGVQSKSGGDWAANLPGRPSKVVHPCGHSRNVPVKRRSSKPCWMPYSE